MRSLKLLALALLFVPNLALAGAAACTPTPGFWCEQFPNAGNRFSPQDIVGGPYSGIEGTIGGGDLVDAFRFTLLGTTTLTATTVLNPIFDTFAAATLPLPDPDSIGTALYPNNPTLSTLPIAPFIQSNDGMGMNTKTWTGLTSGGIYIIEFTFNGMDPPFMFSPLGGPFIAAAAIPEPSTWALMLAGLAGIMVMTRRRIGC